MKTVVRCAFHLINPKCIEGIEQKLEVIIKDLGELKAGSGSGFDSLRESLIERLDATDEKVQQVSLWLSLQ